MLEALKKTYRCVCTIEERFISFTLCAITVLIFVSAIGRFVGRPINWAVDISSSCSPGVPSSGRTWGSGKTG